MKDYNEDKLDKLLFLGLKSDVAVDDDLNKRLKIEITRITAQNQIKGLSLWWLPALLNTFFSLVSMVFIYSFLSIGIITATVILALALSSLFAWILTAIGVKKFHLVKGGII